MSLEENERVKAPLRYNWQHRTAMNLDMVNYGNKKRPGDNLHVIFITNQHKYFVYLAKLNKSEQENWTNSISK